MVDRRWAGQRVGSDLLAWAEGKIRESDRGIARLDCVRANHRLRAYYEAHGSHARRIQGLPKFGVERVRALREGARVIDDELDQQRLPM